MGFFSELACARGSISSIGIAVALRPPSKSELLQAVSTFPFNVILAMAAVLVIGTVFAFTRKPVRPNIPRADDVIQPMQEAEEEIPRGFEDYRDGIGKLYNWFYGFTQRKFEGIADNMTPREFMRTVLSRIPSDEALTLEYLVTIFEITNYSDSKLTKEMYDRSLRAVELLKDLIESGSSKTRAKHSFIVRARANELMKYIEEHPELKT